MSMHRYRTRLGVLLALLVLPGALRAQADAGAGIPGGSDVLRGRVLSTSGSPITGATVVITGLLSRIVRSTVTDEDGAYTLVSASAEGEYMIAVKAIGFRPARRRALRSLQQQGSVIVTDVTMESVLALDTVAVVVPGDTLRPAADPERRETVGDEAEAVDLEQAKLFATDPSDVTTLLRGTPGVTLLPLGYSVFGQPPEQNKTLLNGSKFDGTRVPQDALQSLTLTKNTYDVSQGGFAGGQLELTSQTGTNVRLGQLRLTYNDPRLEWHDPASAFTPTHSQSLSGSISGPFKKNEAFYHVAFQIDHSATDAQSLLTADSAVLALQGIRPDTLRLADAVLRRAGVPLTTAGIPTAVENLSRSVSLDVNATPSATSSVGVNFVGSWVGQDGNGISAFTYPSSGVGNRSSNTSLRVSSSVAFGHFLNEFHGSVGAARSSQVPYVTLPQGLVQVTTVFADGRTGATSLPFGGDPGGKSVQTSGGWDVSNTISWLSADNRHQVKFGQSLTQSWAANGMVTGQFGTYLYSSLADLSANAPASYSRTLASPATSNNSLQGSLSLGDVFTRSKAWQFQYGVRMDVAHAGTRPAYNPVVDSIFGRRTDRVPHDVGLSPRFGFVWNSWGDRDMSAALAQAAARGKSAPTPVTVSGGVGAFRGVIPPSRIQSLTASTGLPNTIRRLDCVGAAVPVPDWSQFGADAGAVPYRCTDGTAPVAFSTDRPDVQLYDPSYRSPLRWSGNVSASGLAVKEWPVTVNADYSLGFHEESQIDLNLRHTPVGVLAAEGRPMYVTPDAIVPSSGAIAPGASRISAAFGSVMSTQADLRNMNASVSVAASAPRPFFGRVPVKATYTWTRSRAQYRDAGGSDPLALVWSDGPSLTHQLTMDSSFPIWKFMLRSQVILTSGTPYTPLVNMDVNGDGMGGDRAFIVDPAATSDTALGRQMSALLASADPHVRECLQRQMGRIAGNNSCRTGWQLLVQPNVSVNVSVPNPAKGFAPFNDRLKISILTENTMSVISRLTGLTNGPLIRNTTYMPLDPTLLYVTGYDSVAHRFTYQVNQQFGDTRRRITTRGDRAVLPPFRIYMTGELTLGGPPHRTYAQRLGLVPVGDASPLSVEEVLDRLRRLTSNPIQQILDMQDSLSLSERQVADVKQIAVDFEAQADDILRPIAEYVVKHGKRTDDEQLASRIAKARGQIVELGMSFARQVCSTFGPDQVGKLPESFGCRSGA